jgi:hypothetical protein
MPCSPAIASQRRSAIRWSKRQSLLLVVLLAAAGSAGAAGRGADGKFETRTSSHFILHQDVDIDESGGLRGSRRFEQQVLAELERAYDRLDVLLGLRPRRPIEVVIYDPDAFDSNFRGLFRFSAAGFYHGVIRVRGTTQLTVQLSQVLHHELAHAGFDAAAPSMSLPGWLSEGAAEWFAARALGKRHLSAGQLGALTRSHREGTLLPLSSLSRPTFGRLGNHAASLAYLQSYAMVEFLARKRGERELREFCRELVRTRDLERSMKKVFRMGQRDLEARFIAELG